MLLSTVRLPLAGGGFPFFARIECSQLAFFGFQGIYKRDGKAQCGQKPARGPVRAAHCPQIHGSNYREDI
jgi:hypothetical protein